MRTGRRVEDGSFREQVGHLVPQFGTHAPSEDDHPIDAAPAVVRRGSPSGHMNQFLFDGSKRFAAISRAAAISKSSSGC